MANLTKRIIDLQTTSTLGSDDYVMIDGATNGTKKYLLKDILDEIEDVKDGTGLATGAVTTDKLAAGAVTNAKIDDGAVDTTNIADDAVTAAKIDDGAVGTDALAANAVTGAKIATGAVGTGNIASGAVTLAKIASDSNATSSRDGLMSSADKAKLDGFSAASNYALKSDIVGAYIFKGSVNTENDLPSTGLTVGDVYNIIAASSYGESGANVAWTGTTWDALGESFDISDGAIDTEQLANGAVTNDKLAEEAMTTVSPIATAYEDTTYGSGMRQGYSVTFGNTGETVKLPQVDSDLLIDVENIPTIPEKKIGSGAITANKIGAGAVSAEKLANGAVTNDKLATAAVSTDKIASLAVTTNKIAAGAVDNSKLANNAVGTAQIVNGAVTSEKLGSDVATTINSKAAASDVTTLQEYVDEELEYKADIDGYYSQLTAGLAENLIGRGDAVPAEYLYRTAGGTADIEDGIATIDCIKGNTLVWNQLIRHVSQSDTQYGGTVTRVRNPEDGTVTYNGTAEGTGAPQYSAIAYSFDIINGHTYYMSKRNGELSYYINVNGSNNHVTTNSTIFTAGEERINAQMYMVVPATGYTFNNFVVRPQLFDLTLMFGAGNEPSSAAEFEAMFPEPYYPYSAPKLLPVDIRGIETIGFNLLEDADSFNKSFTGYANNVYGNNASGRKAFIDNLKRLQRLGQTLYWHIASSTTVTTGAPVGQLRLQNASGSALVIAPPNSTFSLDGVDLDAVTAVILYGPQNQSGSCTFSEACINLSWSGYRNGEYEEYWSAERSIDTSRFFPTGLKKVGDKADALYADHYDAVIGSVDLGTLTWTEYTGGTEHTFRTAATTPIPRAAGVTNVFCAMYETGTGGNRLENLQIAGGSTTSTVYVRNDTFDTAENVEAALSGVILYYELATPTTTEIDPPLNLSYKVSDFGTERIMVNEIVDAPQTAPVPMEVEYGLNAIDTIRRLPTNYVPRPEVEQLLDEKADVDGYYAAMTVGAADNLTGRGDGASGQYFYRTAGGDEDIADGIANIRSIKGQTIVWNQRCNRVYADGSTISIDGTTTTVTGTGSRQFFGVNASPAANNVLIANHKYIVSAEIDPSGITSEEFNAINFGFGAMQFTVLEGGTAGTSVEKRLTKLIALGDNLASTAMYISASFSTTVDTSLNSFVIRDPQIFDLTLMFGAGNEPSTIADFETMFPKIYYPYIEPTLLSVNMEGIETVGFNLLDLESLTDEHHDNTYRILDFPAGKRGKCIMTLIDKDPSVALPSDCGIGFVRSNWDRNKDGALVAYDFRWVYLNQLMRNRSNTNGGTGSLDGSMLLDAILIYPRTDAALEAIKRRFDICVNFQWSGYRNGEYEDYWNSQREIPLATYFPDGMRSAGSVADELTSSKAITRVGAVDLGTLTWVRQDADYTTTYRSTLTGKAIGMENLLAVGFSLTGESTTNMSNLTYRGHASNSNIYFRDDTYSTAADFKTAMSGVMLYYELAEPTEVTIEPPLNLSYKVSDFGTEKVMVDEEADAPQSAPPIIQTAYGINATDTVRRLPTQYISHESFQQFVAAIQSAVGITVTETWDENDGRYEYTVTQTGE